MNLSNNTISENNSPDPDNWWSFQIERLTFEILEAHSRGPFKFFHHSSPFRHLVYIRTEPQLYTQCEEIMYYREPKLYYYMTSVYTLPRTYFYTSYVR